MSNHIEILKEINQNAKMGMDSLTTVINKVENSYSFMDSEIKNILSDFIRLQEKNIDGLKEFL